MIMRFLLIFLSVPLLAQTSPSPYVSMQQRTIKALSDDAIRDYRAGAGMSLALAAELNGYPGPKHILELADPLRLTDAQKAAVKKVFDSMHEDAVQLGNEILELETALDAAFRGGQIEKAELATLTSRIGSAQARLRYRHLLAHIESREILTAEQRQEYAKLRGYSAQNEHQHQHQHHH